MPSSLAWQAAYLLDTVEGDTILSEVDQVLLLVGTLCVQHHQPELWRTIYHAALAHPQRDTNEPFEYLEHLSDAARRGEL